MLAIAELDDMWDVILEDRLARKSSSTTMAYFIKMQEMQVYGKRKICGGQETPFLNADVVVTTPRCSRSSECGGIERTYTLSASPISCLGSGPVSPASATSSGCILPINLSTLLPLSKTNLLDLPDSNTQMPSSWIQNGTLNIPGLPYLRTNEQQYPKYNSSKTLSWPGIDAIVDSYKKYNQGKKIKYNS